MPSEKCVGPIHLPARRAEVATSTLGKETEETEGMGRQVREQEVDPESRTGAIIVGRLLYPQRFSSRALPNEAVVEYAACDRQKKDLGLSSYFVQVNGRHIHLGSRYLKEKKKEAGSTTLLEIETNT